MEHTSITVIIPTLNAAAYLAPLVKRLQTQEQTIAEIIVIDSSSTDQTADLVRSLQVKMLTLEPGTFDHGATRNLAAAETKADIIIFMAQDALPVDNQTIGNLVKPLEAKQTVLSYARQIAAAEASPSEKYLRLANYPPVSLVKSKQHIPALGIRTFQNSNVCAAYRRKEFEALGCFPQPAVCNEDMIFAARAIFAGYNVAYSAEAKVWHSHNYNSVALFKRYFDIAASLDNEPSIRKFGKAEKSGLQFFKKQLLYLREERQLAVLPRVILETVAKYLGYKCGTNHNHIPGKWEIHLGMNKLYWTNNPN